MSKKPQMKKMNCPCPECPQAGDMYKCATFGMTVEVTVACKCADPACVSLACCGAPLTKQT
jgi:hypothetical protein